MRFTRLIPALAFLGVVSCVAEPAEEKVDTPAPSTDSGVVFDLRPDERRALEASANAGDSEAAFRLAQYYGISCGPDGRCDPEDHKQSRAWMQRAASLGHEGATSWLEPNPDAVAPN